MYFELARGFIFLLDLLNYVGMHEQGMIFFYSNIVLLVYKVDCCHHFHVPQNFVLRSCYACPGGCQEKNLDKQP